MSLSSSQNLPDDLPSMPADGEPVLRGKGRWSARSHLDGNLGFDIEDRGHLERWDNKAKRSALDNRPGPIFRGFLHRFAGRPGAI